VEQVFVVDRNRATCAGQIACLDYSLFMLERFYGRALREAVANDLIYPIARSEDAQKRQIINGHAWHTNPILARAQTLMQSYIEEPLSIAKIAAACGISQRELEHLFQKYLKASPKSYYTTFRLQRARELLLYSALSVRETGLACGFVSPTTHFRAFRSSFKVSPLSYRKAFQGAPSSPDGRRLY
jgi:transcriptional regulator GlxA family with amidase domain